MSTPSATITPSDSPGEGGRFSVAHWAVAALLCFVFVAPKVLMHASVNTHDYDTGIYSNLAWNIAHGEGFHSDIRGHNHLGEHFSPIIAALAPLYLVWPSAQVLMTAQGLAVAAALALMLWLAGLLLRDLPARARAWLTVILMAMFVCYKPLLAAWDFEFQPVVLGMPLVAAGIIALHRRANGWLAVFVVLLLATRESAPLSVLGLGIYAALVLRRRRAGVVLAAAAAVAAAIVLGLVMPAFRDGAWDKMERLAPFAYPGEKAVYLLRLLLLLGLLPLLGWRALLAAVPGVLLNLAVSHRAQFGMWCHYDAQLCVFVMAAAIHGARRLAHLAARRPVPERLARIAPWAALACVVVLGAWFRGPVLLRELARRRPTSERRALRAEVMKYVRMPADVPIAAEPVLGPQVCHRRTYTSLAYFDERTRRELVEGELILLLDRRPGRGLMHVFEDDPRAELVGRGGGLVVFRWRGPD